MEKFKRAHIPFFILPVLVLLTGIMNTISAILPPLPENVQVLEQIFPFYFHYSNRFITVVVGYLLVFLSFKLFRRKRAAWTVTIILLSLSAITHILKGLNIPEAVLNMGMIAVAVLFRGHFHALSDPDSSRRGWRTAAFSLVFILIYGTTGFFLLDTHFKISMGLGESFLQTLSALIPFIDLHVPVVTGFGNYFVYSLLALATVALLISLTLLLKPVLWRRYPNDDEINTVSHLLRMHGLSPISAISKTGDKPLWFGTAQNFASFSVRNGVAVTLGDPVCPAENFSLTLDTLIHFYIRNDWTPLFYQTSPRWLRPYQAAGFDTIMLGQESFIDPASFSLQGGARQSLRTAMNRYTKEKYSTQLVNAPLSHELVSKLAKVSDDWLDRNKYTEKGFSYGSFSDEWVRSNPAMVVLDPSGIPAAFLTLVEYGSGCYTVDLMRSRGELPNGHMEYIIVSLILWAKENRIKELSLGLSPLAGLTEIEKASVGERLLAYVYRSGGSFFNFKGLHEFKKKFATRFESRYLAYPRFSNFPALLIALGLVHGFKLDISEIRKIVTSGKQNNGFAS